MQSDAPLHEVLREAAQSLPGGVSFLILSRSDPPASLARFQLHGDLAFLGWDELQLTLDEAQSIASLRSPGAAQNRIEELHRLTQGWVAGLRLLLDQDERTGFRAQLKSGKAQQVLFDYFATEVFEKWLPPIQAALLKTALLPVMTVPQAEQLVGERNIGRVLADLHRSNYFVVLRMDDEPRYEYHSLFQGISVEPCARILLTKLNGAHYSVKLQSCWRSPMRPRRGIALLRFSALERTAKPNPARSGGNDRCGRHQTLLQWLNWLPQAEFEHTPWLWYWRGLARLPFDPIEARSIFEQAYLGFPG